MEAIEHFLPMILQAGDYEDVKIVKTIAAVKRSKSKMIATKKRRKT